MHIWGAFSLKEVAVDLTAAGHSFSINDYGLVELQSQMLGSSASKICHHDLLVTSSPLAAGAFCCHHLAVSQCLLSFLVSLSLEVSVTAFCHHS